MSTGNDLVTLAVPHIGETYRLGSVAPKNVAKYRGPWDCAEFASWLVYQLTTKLYGCYNDNGNPGSADAYSGYWARDANSLGKIVDIATAAKTPGAIVLRLAGSGTIGHVVISDGKGGTIEAHSTLTGVVRATLQNRRWDFGVIVPWIDYSALEVVPFTAPTEKIYHWTTPMMHDDTVKSIQQKLGIKADGWYGKDTFEAVKTFQINQKFANLVADGEVGPRTAARLGITL